MADLKIVDNVLWDFWLPIPERTVPVRLPQCLKLFIEEETLVGDQKKDFKVNKT